VTNLYPGRTRAERLKDQAFIPLARQLASAGDSWTSIPRLAAFSRGITDEVPVYRHPNVRE